MHPGRKSPNVGHGLLTVVLSSALCETSLPYGTSPGVGPWDLLFPSTLKPHRSHLMVLHSLPKARGLGVVSTVASVFRQKATGLKQCLGQVRLVFP